MTDFEFRLPVGEYYLQITSQHERLHQSLARWYQFTQSPSGKKLAAIKIVVTDEDYSSHPVEPATKWEGNRCHYIGRGCKGIVEDHDPAILWINPNVGFQYIELFFRIVTAIRIFSQGGVMLHAAGIVKNQLGYIFTGYSGAGKTTVCRLSEGYTVLNDDMVILSTNDSGWKINATPFTNPTQVRPGSGSAPLHKILYLVQDKNHHLEDVQNSIAIAKLLTHVPVISHSPLHSSALLSRCMEIIQKTDVKDLHFLPDKGFWKLLCSIDQP
ncbi:MAG: hypothetical protein K0B14_16450 [Anaerolineaceae bacterium]|nr:hypothetical protein [Anaerolineaceae bacterium]